MDAYSDLIPNQEMAGVSVVAFVFWACALDERLCGTDSAYAARRDGDEHGQVLPALRFTLTAVSQVGPGVGRLGQWRRESPPCSCCVSIRSCQSQRATQSSSRRNSPSPRID